MIAIELKDIKKKYNLKNKEILVLNKLNAKFEMGKFYAIMGHSGSGKSTLISIISGIEDIDEGTIQLDNQDITYVSKDEKALIRRNEIGLIFQEFYLDDYLNALENILLPLSLSKKSKKQMLEEARKLLDLVGLSEREKHFPKELSGGEKQRVAIARALANNPKIILCDEPTGNLDEENEKKIFAILKKLSDDGKCVIVVSHSNEVKKYADVVYKLDKGILE